MLCCMPSLWGMLPGGEMGTNCRHGTLGLWATRNQTLKHIWTQQECASRTTQMSGKASKCTQQGKGRIGT